MATNFNNLCAFAEHCQRFKKYVDPAALFEIESSAPRGNATSEEVSLMGRDFRLPFRTVAVEDANSCVIIQDESDDAVGIDAARTAIFCSAPSEGEKVYIGGGRILRAIVKEDGSTMQTHIDTSSLFVCLRLRGEWTKIMGEEEIFSQPGFCENLQLDITTHFSAAIREILFTNVPSNFILESSPAKGPRRNPKKILRAHERPTYTLLQPAQIRRRMRLPGISAGGGVAQHERRAHFRVLRDDRYRKNPDGSPRKLWIPATWVGPTESVVGHRRYRVILD